jgi:hypothetical protein
MAELWELTTLIRSKNAAPFEITLDIIAKDRAALDRIRTADAMQPAAIAALYGLPADQVKVLLLERVNALKISMPRPTPSGHVRDTDIFGGQFHSPLVRLAV